jgi:membrane dipeptidase
MITDLHCHYPMHLVHAELARDRARTSWWKAARDRIEQATFDLAALLFNDPAWTDRWRVDVDGLRAGGVGTVCSVLYWPGAELLPKGGPHPLPGSFKHLVKQLEDVEQHLGSEVVVKRVADLERGNLRFVHCIEGGFHLGPDTDDIGPQIEELASRGVAYITLAHLVPRGVAANAPAFPMLTDEEYHDVFPQDPGVGLTALGEEAVRAMARNSVVVDVSHMRQDAIDETFALLDTCDPDRTLPVIASHVGVRSAGPDDLEYNLVPSTMQAIARRGGVIGVILSEHLMGDSHDEAGTRKVLGDHIRAIHDELGTHDHTAIGSDLDGFIKPTLEGLDNAADLARLEAWIREDFPDAAEGILHANADGVIRRVFELREG